MNVRRGKMRLSAQGAAVSVIFTLSAQAFAQMPSVAPAQTLPPLPARENVMAYEASKKSLPTALALEAFLPGVGSVYANHLRGAVITWITQVVGVSVGLAGVLTWKIDHDHLNPQAPSESHDNTAPKALVVTGLVTMIGGRIYGLIDAGHCTAAHNRNLRLRFGISDQLAFGVIHVRSRGSLALLPTIGFRF